MKRQKTMLGMFLVVMTLLLAACNGDKQEMDTKESNEKMKESETHEGMGHEEMEMDHSSSGEVPADLKESENPTYKVGSKATIETDHMEGMQGAEATIVGAYDTTAYIISYTPTTGGEKVENHKWVIHEELKDAGKEPLKPGAEVTIDASHMKGMDGATAEIVSAEQTTVYMIDYTSTADGEKVKNHKWVTDSELSAK